MLFELNIKKIDLPKIPINSIGRNRIQKKITENLPEYLELINYDLFSIVKFDLNKDIIQNPG
ncbi:MAG: hypothetical protein ACK4PR_03070 [Gammaproteobacteria bacterium]